MTVSELLDRMDSRELAEWRAFYNIEPFDERRKDLQSAIVASTFYNVMRQKGRAKKVTDFMPDFSKGRQDQESLNTKIIETFKSIKPATGNR